MGNGHGGLQPCSYDAPQAIDGQDEIRSRHASSSTSPLSADADLAPQAWSELLHSLEDDAVRTAFVGSEVLPSDLRAEHRDLLRVVLERSDSSLESVTIGNVTSETARLLTEALQSARKLHELKFTGVRADDALAKLLGALLRPVWVKGPSLRCLIIANQCRNLLTDRGAVAIAQALEENTCLQTLVLFGTQMGDGAAKAITAALDKNTQLQVLSFYGKALSSKGISTFARWIKAGSFLLNELVIGGSEFVDDDGQALVRAVARRKNEDFALPLKRFGLLNVHLGDGLVPALVDLVSCGLAEVSVLAGKLSDQGVETIARCAFGLRSGTALFAAGDVPAETAHMQNLGSLQSLRLATQSAGNAGLKSISEAWLEGQPPTSCEMAFGSASAQMCEEMTKEINSSDASKTAPTLRSAAFSTPTRGSNELQRSNTEGSDWLWVGCGDVARKRRLIVTCDVPKYLEEVLFPRLMLRDPRSIAM